MLIKSLIFKLELDLSTKLIQGQYINSNIIYSKIYTAKTIIQIINNKARNISDN